MNKKKIETLLNEMCKTGADFAEVFHELSCAKGFNYLDSMLENISFTTEEGVGLRIALQEETYYAATSNLKTNNLLNVISSLNSNINEPIKYKDIKLNKLKVYEQKTKENNEKYSDLKIRNLMADIDQKIRNKSDKVLQVNIIFNDSTEEVTIANHTGLYKKENRRYSRLFIKVTFKDGERVETTHYSKGLTGPGELLKQINYDEVIEDLVNIGLDKLKAVPCLGKEMPVIIGPGFGGVIFHEACGHAMEATSVATKQSCLSDKLNQKIASDKVTIIDDGTISLEWGTTLIDDEGAETKKNILIKDGVLVGYLIDELNARKMHMPATGSSRRESYAYAPTSRMTNTYLLPGNDKFEDMVASIKLGLYAKNLGGGCVSTETGEFNFAVEDGYMIRDGKIAEPVKSASLIGNTLEILKEVSMVSDDLQLAPGMCGSISGAVPVNVGEPTIKVDKILVGGGNVEE